jgi:membrane-bound lytic murein transglycosylase D
VQRQLGRQNQSSYWDLLLNEETARYVYRILAMKEIFNHADQYGFVMRPAELYEPLVYKTLTVDTAITNLASFAGEQGISYKLLKWYNPWLRENYLKVAAGKSYQIRIPN